MKLPRINIKNQYTRRMIAFGGLNVTKNIKEGELCECSGISHAAFPAITQRQKLQSVGYTSPDAVHFEKELFVADGGKLYYGEKCVGECSLGKKQIVSINGRIIVFPDKIYYDTNTEELGSLEATYILDDVTFTSNSLVSPSVKNVVKIENEKSEFRYGESILSYDSVYTNTGKVVVNNLTVIPCQDVQEGKIFKNRCLNNQYRIAGNIAVDEEKGTVTIENELISIVNELEGVFSEFRKGDAVEITGCNKQINDKLAVITNINGTTLTFDENTFTEDTQGNSITIKRKIPDFSCICNYGNRLWGCEGNTIYASKLGDPFNYFIYNQLSTDSFTVTSNTSGDFTACVAYGGSCLFFKENSCYKLYGTRPSNFQLVETLCGGVSKDSAGSVISTVNGIFYRNSEGVYISYGGAARCISQKLEGIAMKNAVAGCDNHRYFIAGDGENGRRLYVYDIEKDLWSIFGETTAKDFCYCNGALHIATDKGLLKLTNEADNECEWYFTLCQTDENYHRAKSYNKLYITLTLEEKSWVCVEIEADGGLMEKVFYLRGEKRRNVKIPISIKKCHEMKIKISGKGKSVIESIVREFSVN